MPSAAVPPLPAQAGASSVATGAPYPTAAPVGNFIGLPSSSTPVKAQGTSDVSINGALVINPAWAGDFYSGNFFQEDPAAGNSNATFTNNDVVGQTQATQGHQNAWKDRPAPQYSNAIMFGGGKPQPAILKPWLKKWIPPLAMYNDAAQWVNLLMFNRPMQASDNGNSMPNLPAQYFTPPPVNSLTNLAAGELNLQLQLGTIAIQGQQLTQAASNYFGGS